MENLAIAKSHIHDDKEALTTYYVGLATDLHRKMKIKLTKLTYEILREINRENIETKVGRKIRNIRL